MDVFLAALPAAISRIAAAILLLSADKSAQKYIHLKFTFIFKQPLNYDTASSYDGCEKKLISF